MTRKAFMSILNLINNESLEIDEDTKCINQTVADLIKQLDGTVNLIKTITDKHGKVAILNNMTEQDAQVFNLLWSKLETAVEDIDYDLPQLSNNPINN
jgi:hypothetical protein